MLHIFPKDKNLEEIIVKFKIHMTCKMAKQLEEFGQNEVPDGFVG
jgi:hypothetical protein